MATDTEAQAKTNLAANERLAGLIGEGAFDRLGEVLADGLVDHDPAPDQPAGPAGIAEFWKGFTASFSDLKLEPVQVVATEDFVTAVLDVSGKHTGEFQGHEATGRTFTVRGIQVGRFEDGKMIERWGATDTAGMLEQLGLS